MQAHPTGVLPGPAEAGKGQLQGAGGWVKTQLAGGEVLQQQPADAKPQGVAAGEQHRRAPRRQGLPHRANDLVRPVAGQKLGAGACRRNPAGGLLGLPPGHHLRQQPRRCHQQLGPTQQLQAAGSQAYQATGIGADHHQHPTLICCRRASCRRAAQKVACHWSHDGQSIDPSARAPA